MSTTAQDIARKAAIADAEKASQVGAFISEDIDHDNRVTTFLFEADLAGYKGWRWCVTVAQVDEKAEPTVCDVVVLPGPDSLLAPEWIEYRDRILPEDIQPGVIVPSILDDTRLAPGLHSLIQDEELDPAQVFDLGLSRMQVIVAQLRQLRRVHQSHAKHADSSYLLQVHYADPSAYAQMRSHQMMHA